MTRFSNDGPPRPDKAREEDYLSRWNRREGRRAVIDFDDLRRTDELLDGLLSGAPVQGADDPALALLVALVADVRTPMGDDADLGIATLIRLAALEPTFDSSIVPARSDAFATSGLFEANVTRQRRRLAVVAASMLVTSGIGVAAASPSGPIATQLQTAIASVLGTGPSAQDAATAALARAEAALANGDIAAARAALIEAAEAASDVGGQQAAELWSQIEAAEERLSEAVEAEAELSLASARTLRVDSLVQTESLSSPSQVPGGAARESVVAPGLSASDKSGSANSDSTAIATAEDDSSVAEPVSDSEGGSDTDTADKPVNKPVKAVESPAVTDDVSGAPAKSKAVDPEQGGAGDKAVSANPGTSTTGKSSRAAGDNSGANADVNALSTGSRAERVGKPTDLPVTADDAATTATTP